MFRQFKYALLDIKLSKRINIIFFLQMIIVFLLINSSINDIIRVNNGITRLENLKNNKAYINRDATSNGKVDALIADQDNSIPKLKELYQYIINNSKFDKYSKWEYTTLKSINDNPIIQSTANKMFFDIYDIKVIEGRMFNNSDFTNDLKVIPIVVGYDLKDVYKLGETYFEIDPATNNKVTYEVIGVLEHNSSYPSLVDIGQELDLNYTFFQPLNMQILNDFGSIDMAISSTVVFTNNESDVTAIEQKSVELGLFSMNYRPIQERIDEFLGYFRKKMIYQISIAIMVLLFASTSMALNLTTIITKKMREISIHLICGGSIYSILQRFLWQLIIVQTLALVPTIFVYKIDSSLIYTILIAVLISTFIMIMPYFKIKTTNIVELVRRNE